MKLKAMETVQPLPAMSDEISRTMLVSGERGVGEMHLRDDLTVDVLAKSGRAFRVFAQNVRWVEPAAEQAPEAELPSPPSTVAEAEPVPDTSTQAEEPVSEPVAVEKKEKGRKK